MLLGIDSVGSCGLLMGDVEANIGVKCWPNEASTSCVNGKTSSRVNDTPCKDTPSLQVVDEL